MSKEQIEELAKDLQETHDYEGCEAWHCGDCQYEKYGKGYFCSSIKQAEKMTAKSYRKQEWISVDDRLPKELTHIIVCDEDRTVGEALYLSANHFEWLSSEELAFVTHWMPLPEAPKMEGGAEQ
jgi:hypothetical protein